MKATQLKDLAPTRKRRVWQIHLSTALVLMFVASVFVYVNVRSKRSDLRFFEAGWPRPMIAWGPLITNLKQQPVSYWYCGFLGEVFVNWENVGVNLLVLSVAILVCAAGCEVLIRRRAKR